LTMANLRFVVSVAKQYQNQGLTLPDLINEGNIGLIKAAQRFDETRGFKFISYAVWWIRQSILMALADQSRIVRLPLNRIGTISKVNKMAARLEQEYQREPDADEIASFLDMKVNDVEESLKHFAKHVSMDAPIIQDEDMNMYDLLQSENVQTPEGNLLYESLKKEIERATSTLHKREKEVLMHYFGLNNCYPLTLDEIGMKVGLTRERVRQIKEKAIRKLKNTSRCKNLKTYLG
jgi:RNA polymerase primary sigma factor